LLLLGKGVVSKPRDKIGAGTWDRDCLTLGVEEEFHLVDLSTRRLTPRAAEVLSGLSASTRTFAAELQQTVVETNTAVAVKLDGLRRHLEGLRAELVDAALPLGIGVASAGTMPISLPPVTITETPRFRRMLADYQLLVREQLICGMQVHVGIGEPDVAVALVDRVSRWLPPLLALSASSPFSHLGKDSGYASTRSLIWSRWPTTGGAGALSSAAEYDAIVRSLVASGVISDPGMIYFDVRPSSHVPTIEVRICDACPSVDTVVLIAGLFRAIVARELGRYDAGEPSPSVAPVLQRAAMWRAARSGLEGELVDLAGPRSVPAGKLVRAMVAELRPELESYGDWESVHSLSEMALAHGSSACQQRDALHRRDRIDDVIDLVVAQTCGRARDSQIFGGIPSLLEGYAPPGFDDAILPDGRPRPSHAAALEAFASMDPGELQGCKEAFEREKTAAGMVFRPSNSSESAAFPVDLLPRILTGEEWSRVQGGTSQRARALDAFLQDIYGEAAIVRDGVLPAWMVDRSPGHRACGTAPPAGSRRAHVSGFDVVRDADGRWLVLEDNVRVPSGVAYAMLNRRLMKRVFPELTGSHDLFDPDAAPALLRQTLEESAPPRAAASSPTIVLLSDGPDDSAFFEHETLARLLGVPVAQPKDLVVADDVLWHFDGSACADGRATPSRRRVDVVYLRMDDQLAQRKGANGRWLEPQLVHAVRAGTLTLANALGNGVADDKAIYAYVPRFIDYYLKEIPLLEQVRTYHCADPDERRHVLANLDRLVMKPVDGYGGIGVVIGPRASDEEIADVRALILRRPGRWIAQEAVNLSTHPTYERGTFLPRHVDLRVFVYYGDEPVVVPAALTRVAPPGSLIVNSSRGGGAKDTWLLR
jgi:glutamate---cysteine ligase / carboxylate-amine ligase